MKIVAFLAAILLFMLTACGTNTPSLGLAPGKQLVEKALALQVSKTQQQLTQQLQSDVSDYEITQVKLKQLETLFVGELPTYHFRGNYTLELNQSDQQATQQKNSFDIYLQRQKEGKTWRLAIPDVIEQDAVQTWRTYLIPY